MTSLPWILLFLPLVVAAVNQLVLRKSTLVPWVSTVSAVATLVISFLLLGKTGSPEPIHWASIGTFHLDIGIHLDRLSTGMMLVVTGVGALVHIFSLAYMRDDDAKNRYFTGLSFFMFSMTGIVLANNFIMTFIFWELVGFSSYLLIGHWYQKESAADAAKKAFLCNRVGDFGFMIGILMLWGITGTLTFDAMKSGLVAFGADNAAYFAQNSAAYSVILSTVILCIFCGAVGKSAQIPLHVWLPDAMEGPTPVSALIHAATMVAAGVYMLFRLQTSIGAEAFAGFAGDVIAWTGGITALVAALMAVQQDDIKRVLAYSTLSQLGYMVMAVGLVAGEAGMFHLFTHAWFKALLFLGSGAVIHACHHEQDIWKMGGLLRKMPITGITFALGFLALIAFPGTSGFFSKELILHAAHEKQPFLFWLAVFVATLTPFYMTRLFVVAFLGRSKSDHADHAHEVSPLMWVPLAVLAVLAVIGGFLHNFAPAAPEEAGEFHLNFLFWVSLIALILGVGSAFLLYAGKDKDPLSIPLLKNRFYIDDFYDNFIVRYFQDVFAAIMNFFDELVINGLFVGGFSRLAASTGNLFRQIQSGSLQGYSFAFGLGVVLVIYFTVFL
jgi:NADH-quinone oxidoreductase subunit L